MAKQIPKYLVDEMLTIARMKCLKVAEEKTEKLREAAKKMLKAAEKKAKTHPSYRASVCSISDYALRNAVEEFGSIHKYYTPKEPTETEITVSINNSNKEDFAKEIRELCGKDLDEISAKVAKVFTALEKQYQEYKLKLIMGKDVAELPEFEPVVPEV